MSKLFRHLFCCSTLTGNSVSLTDLNHPYNRKISLSSKNSGTYSTPSSDKKYSSQISGDKSQFLGYNVKSDYECKLMVQVDAASSFQIYQIIITKTYLYILEEQTRRIIEKININFNTNLRLNTIKLGQCSQQEMEIIKRQNSLSQNSNQTLTGFCLTKIVNKKMYGLFNKQHEEFSINFISENIKEVKKCFDILRLKVAQPNFKSQYQAIERIGFGTTSQVYKIQRFEDKQLYAVKVFDIEKCQQNKFGLECIYYEIDLMRNCQQYENILKVIEFFQDDKFVYIITPFCAGQSLGHLLQREIPFTMADISYITKQILLAAQNLHKSGIMHRDINPDNVLFKKSCSLKHVILSDMGLATEIHMKQFRFHKVGTPGYSAPEVCKQQIYNERCDIYSIGAILHQFLIDTLPFPQEKCETMFKQNTIMDIDFTQSKYQNIDQLGLDLLKKMMCHSNIYRISLEDALNHEFITKYSKDIEFISQQYLIEDEEGVKKSQNSHQEVTVMNIRKLTHDEENIQNGEKHGQDDKLQNYNTDTTIQFLHSNTYDTIPENWENDKKMNAIQVNIDPLCTNSDLKLQQNNDFICLQNQQQEIMV